ncbi:NfeD family protein [Chloroflexota bacterium]
MTAARLVLAIVSTSLEEVAIWVVWRWGLPQLGVNIPFYILIVVMVGWLVWSAGFFVFVTKTLRRQKIIGLPTMVGSKGKVTNPLTPEGMVTIRSELWQAESVEGDMDKGEEVMVVGEDGLKLVVRKGGVEKSSENK